jgi:type II secretory ATPase GspE/PulE/Tfp pilus assembly ATPase PilB-like protein
VYHTGKSDDFVVTNEALHEATQHVEFFDEPESAQAQDEAGQAWTMSELTSVILFEAEKVEAELIMIGPMDSGGRVRFQIDGEFHTFPGLSC